MLVENSLQDYPKHEMYTVVGGQKLRPEGMFVFNLHIFNNVSIEVCIYIYTHTYTTSQKF